jgi:hypothetical protein
MYPGEHGCRLQLALAVKALGRKSAPLWWAFHHGISGPQAAMANHIRPTALTTINIPMQFRAAPFQSESLARLVRKLPSVHEQQKRFTRTKNQNVCSQNAKFSGFFLITQS